LQSVYRLLQGLITLGQRLDIWSSLLQETEEMHETRLTLPARLRPTWGDMDRKGDRHILLHPGRKTLPMRSDILSQLVHRPPDHRRGKDREPQTPSNGVGLRAVGGDTNRRVRLLHRTRKHLDILHPQVFPLIR